MYRITLVLALAVALSPGLARAGGDEDISKVNGSITVQASQRAGDLSTVNGGIRVEEGAGVGDISTVNGGVRIGDQAHAREVGTVNGSLRLGDDVAVESLNTVNGSINGGARLKVDGDARTVSGSIFIDRGSDIRGAVGTVNGGIGLVGTRVGGNVETVNGDITIGIDSHVAGSLHVRRPNASWSPVRITSSRRPRIVVGPNAVVEGDLVFERDVQLYIHESARTGAITGAEPIRFSGARAPRD